MKLFLLLLLLPLSLVAQVNKVKAKIINPGSLYSTYDFDVDAGSLKAAIKKQGCSSLLPNIINYSHEENWPELINNFDSRYKNRELLTDYNVYKIVSTPDYCILLIPAKENKHMAPNMRPAQDMYFIMELKGAQFAGNNPAKEVEKEAEETISSDDYDDYDEEIKATISNPGDLFASFDMKTNEYAKSAMLESDLLSEEEFNLLAEMVKETNWPEGIATLSSRIASREEIKKYTAYFVISFGPTDEYTMIWIPMEENTHMPKNMQPTSDMGIYMVFKTDGITFE